MYLLADLDNASHSLRNAELSTSGHRIGVISTRPCRRSSGLLVRRHNLNNRAVCASDHQESTDDDYKDAPSHHQLPFDALVLLRAAPVVV